MKTSDILENELMSRNSSGVAKMATQMASAAAVQFKGPRAKEAATAAANRAYSIMLKTIDEYFNRMGMKDVN